MSCFASFSPRIGHTTTVPANHDQIEQSKQCGCFFCRRIFPTSEVTDYVSREESTALCPYCYTVSVLGDASGYPITEEFLKEMNKRWF